MPDCPRCHQTVATQAIACPHCRTPLKAYGHPGMTLHRATGNEPLCLTCTYHADDTCTFPKRPEAMDCTLYNDARSPIATPPLAIPWGVRIKTWVKRHTALLAVAGLLLVSLALALLR